MCVHRGQGKMRRAAVKVTPMQAGTASAPKMSRRDRFAVRHRLQSSRRGSRDIDDLVRHRFNVLCSDGSLVCSSRFLSGETAGRTMFLSRAAKNSEIHALNGNTPKTAALKAQGAKKATAKAAHGSALLKCRSWK